jgi:hypothetical protein
VTVRIAQLDGAPAGLTITARLRDGAGTILAPPVTVAPVLDGAGVALDAYTATFNDTGLDLPVELEWRQAGIRVGLDVVNAASADGTVVIPSSLTLEGLKLRVDHTMDTDDDMLLDDLTAAFLQAQAPPPYGTGRLLASDPASDDDPPAARGSTSTSRRVRVPDARSITSVTLDGTAVADYQPVSRNGVVVQLALGDDGNWTRSLGYTESWPPVTARTVVVTGRFGFAQIPVDLAGAIYQLAARWHYERQAQYADQVEVLEGTAVQSYYRQLPPRVKLVFASYAVPPAVGGLR